MTYIRRERARAQGVVALKPIEIRNTMAKTRVAPTKEVKWLIQETIEWAKENGISFFPLVYGTKSPPKDFKWKKEYYLHEKMTTEKQEEEWFGELTNIALVTGHARAHEGYYLVVVDCDKAKIAEKIFGKGIYNKTVTVKTRRGLHVYFLVTYHVRDFKITEIGIDIKGSGYVVGHGSLHPSGIIYEAMKGLEGKNREIIKIDEPFEEWLFEKLKKAHKDFDPNKHRESTDIQKLLDGVEEGNRDEAAVRIATWYRRAEKTQEEAEQLMETWNNKNGPPLDASQLQKCINSAYNRPEPYNYKYTIAPENKIEIEQYTVEEEEAAEKILNSQEILPIVEDTLADVIGERKTKVTLVVLEVADQSVQVSGQSAVGKSFIVDHIALVFPLDHIWKISGVSDKSLRYLKESIGTLYIAEWRGMGGKVEESTAVYDAKLIISEGKLRVTVVEKSKESGKWQTVFYENDNIKNIITTSTDVDIDKEFKTRIWSLSIDESPEQTARILAWRVKQRTLLPSERLNKDLQKKAFRCAMKKLIEEKPKNYIIPYLPLVKEIFDTNKVRVRRDIDKLELAIFAIATLHHRNRPKVEDAVVCMPQDFYWAWEYMNEAIQGTFGEKEKRFEKHWKIAKEILEKGKKLTGASFGSIIGKTERTGRRWLKRFEQAGYITKQGRTKKTGFEYALLKYSDKVKEIKISLDDLFTVTEKWLKDHSKRQKDIGNRVLKNKLKNKKIIFSISNFRPSDLIASLPDAEEELKPSSTKHTATTAKS